MPELRISISGESLAPVLKVLAGKFKNIRGVCSQKRAVPKGIKGLVRERPRTGAWDDRAKRLGT